MNQNTEQYTIRVKNTANHSTAKVNVTTMDTVSSVARKIAEKIGFDVPFYALSFCNLDSFFGYRTNPHTTIGELGIGPGETLGFSDRAWVFAS